MSGLQLEDTFFLILLSRFFVPTDDSSTRADKTILRSDTIYVCMDFARIKKGRADSKGPGATRREIGHHEN